MKKLLFPIFVGFLIYFSSCAEEISSNTVESDKVLRSYYASCTNEGTTYVAAVFYKDGGLTIPPFKEPFGRNLTLDTPSKVFFNGNEMEYNKSIFNEVSYNARLENWPSEFVWEWIDQNGKKHTDRAKMEEIKITSDYLVSDGDDYAVVWEGPPIRKGEEIAVSIEGGDRDYYETLNQVGARKIKINGSGYGLDPLAYYSVDISRTLMIRNTKEISVENVAGSCIKLVYRYEDY